MIPVLLVPGVTLEHAQMGKCMLSVAVIYQVYQGDELTVKRLTTSPGYQALLLCALPVLLYSLSAPATAFAQRSVSGGTLSGALQHANSGHDTLLSAFRRSLLYCAVDSTYVIAGYSLDTAILLTSPSAVLTVVPYLNKTDTTVVYSVCFLCCCRHVS